MVLHDDDEMLKSFQIYSLDRQINIWLQIWLQITVDWSVLDSAQLGNPGVVGSMGVYS